MYCFISSNGKHLSVTRLVSQPFSSSTFSKAMGRFDSHCEFGVHLWTCRFGAMGCWFFGRIASHNLAKKCWKAERHFSSHFFWRVQHIYVTYICFIFGTKEWKDHIHLLFLYVCFFCVDFFFRGKIHRKACRCWCGLSGVYTEKILKTSKVTLWVGGPWLGGMVGWLDGCWVCFFWQGMEHLACFF